ncbi:hypothetical protein CDL15_Pgr005746 [Punica granatum]|uniref:Uncharacterized protein n=1 Tax=Punica granatum TaxID=22663 RepID=A0A218WGF9_PUNGR|nr:hypothetical protein CDL15_Pgr005746 [Punica granatum]
MKDKLRFGGILGQSLEISATNPNLPASVSFAYLILVHPLGLLNTILILCHSSALYAGKTLQSFRGFFLKPVRLRRPSDLFCVCALAFGTRLAWDELLPVLSLVARSRGHEAGALFTAVQRTFLGFADEVRRVEIDMEYRDRNLCSGGEALGHRDRDGGIPQQREPEARVTADARLLSVAAVLEVTLPLLGVGQEGDRHRSRCSGRLVA